MNQRRSTANWIRAYLEWTNADSWAPGFGSLAHSGIRETRVDVSEEFAAAYLDWMDAGQQSGASGPHFQAAASAKDPGGIVDPASGLDVSREALMVALHTESDCTQFLRRILDASDTTPRTVKLASEALEHAARLLEDERRAWRALPGLSRWDLPQSSTARRTDFETTSPHAREGVAADVQALTGTVLALQALSRTLSHKSGFVNQTRYADEGDAHVRNR
ncbi:MAG: hypothetical protein A3G80_12395 [Betaproteobacteria bacterium RIFCSPLOWO2_12_FULL_62_13b]|nr:MAG: hypothetical protein A3G80_12395 [Betaproteobacteria bacterium RIFCSPLOWO2_12_FULL_62_13b]